MAGAVGIVFGLCVLSFTLGAAAMYVVMRRREDASEVAPATSSAAVADDDGVWVPKTAVEPVAEEYDSRPIHRNPVMGLRQLEPALATFAEPVAESAVEPEPVVEVERAAALKLIAAVERVADVEPVAELRPVAGGEPELVAEPEVMAEPELVAEPELMVEPELVAELELVVEPEPVVEQEPAAVAEPEIVGAPRYDQDGDFEPPAGVVEAPESTVAASTDSSEVPAADAATAVPVVVETELPPPAAPQPVEHTTWAERDEFRQRYLRTFEEARRKASSN